MLRSAGRISPSGWSLLRGSPAITATGPPPAGPTQFSGRDIAWIIETRGSQGHLGAFPSPEKTFLPVMNEKRGTSAKSSQARFDSTCLTRGDA